MYKEHVFPHDGLMQTGRKLTKSGIKSYLGLPQQHGFLYSMAISGSHDGSRTLSIYLSAPLPP